MAAKTAHTAPHTPNVAAGEAKVHQSANGAVIVVAPDDAFLIGNDGFETGTIVLGLGIPLRGFDDIGLRNAGDLSGIRCRNPDRVECCVKAAKGRRMRFGLGNLHCGLDGRRGHKCAVHPALIRHIGQDGIQKRQVCAGVWLQVQNVFRRCCCFAGVDGDSAARIHDDDTRAALHAGHHVVQKQVGLRFERVCPHDHDRVGGGVVLIGIVQLVYAHIARGMNL
mmetsp:Transcript_155/g.494  ORF Transcript_155/g.494 Transcript_155/m.494 type:complete len:223 (-) Transcript_155:2372-3040(-)